MDLVNASGRQFAALSAEQQQQQQQHMLDSYGTCAAANGMSREYVR
jgi:hypothetical protein